MDSTEQLSNGRAVYKIEDAVFPGLGTECVPLPTNANYPKVADSIVNFVTSKRKRLSPETVRAHYNSPESVNIISDMFWFCLLFMEQPATFEKFKDPLLHRISQNYLELFVKTPAAEKDSLFFSFHDCVAQGAFYAMFFSFPKSRSKLKIGRASCRERV